MPKLDTVFLWLKGVGLVGGAMCAAFTSALSQWSNTGESPNTLQWAIIVASTAGTGFATVVAFASTATSDYLAKRGGNTDIFTRTPQPQPQPKAP